MGSGTCESVKIPILKVAGGTALLPLEWSHFKVCTININTSLGLCCVCERGTMTLVDSMYVRMGNGSLCTIIWS